MRPPAAALALLAIVALLVASCSSGSSDDDRSATDSADDVATDADAGEADVDDGAPADVEDGQATDGGESEPGSSGQPFDYSTVDYAAEAEESALLGDRDHESFPPPVIDPDLIRSGGPPPDGIFPIDEPTYAPSDEIDYEIDDSEAVLAVEIDGDARAFPVQIMIWHEIVNTEIGGVPVSVTYCPLCNSALTYDRRFGDRILDFGTSGELYQSALVMYDRQTESLWSHFLGTGLVGHFAGAELHLVPTQTLSYGAWKDANPEGLVLTRSLGAPDRYQQLYGSNPYVGYDTEAVDPFAQFFVGEIDRTLLAKARVVGISDDAGSIAVRFEDLMEMPVIPVTDGGRDLVVLYRPGLASNLETGSVADGRDVGQSGVFVPIAEDGTDLTLSADGEGFVDAETGSTWNIQGEATEGPLAGQQLEPVVHTNTFWFAWATYQPDTTLIQP